jgi:hypothetical protein
VKIYIAAQLADAEQAATIAEALIEDGHTIAYEWWKKPRLTPDDWDAARARGTEEVQAVLDSDALVLYAPGARGSHTEFGIAIAARKYVWYYEPVGRAQIGYICPFHHHPAVRRVMKLSDMRKQMNLVRL